MKIINTILFGYFSFLICNSAYSENNNHPLFESNITDIPEKIRIVMRKYTWRPDCPVPLNDLKYLSLNFYGFDHKIHKGNLIVHKDLSKEVVEIFKELYEKEFPIEKMQLMEDFKGNDNSAMVANNTSAFNCRSITGKTRIYSLHSYGRAIDINTKINPYVKGNLVLPENGRPYIDRSISAPGKIELNDLTYQAFIKRGWSWGGSWVSLKDYQHFEKPKIKAQGGNP